VDEVFALGSEKITSLHPAVKERSQ
jgi:hypothetical protein